MKKIASEQDFETLVQTTENLVIDFYADWCGPCQALAPTLVSLEEEFDNKLTIAKLNVDQVPEIASRFGVRSIPTLILFQNQEAIETVVGLHGKEELKKKFATLDKVRT